MNLKRREPGHYFRRVYVFALFLTHPAGRVDLLRRAHTRLAPAGGMSSTASLSWLVGPGHMQTFKIQWPLKKIKFNDGVARGFSFNI
jgi:hypothetical protein